MTRSLSVALFGAPLDTGNLGVDALGLSVVQALARRIDGLELTLFDNGRATRRREIRVGDLRVPAVVRGARISRKVYRGDSLWSMYAASRTSGRLNANVRAIDASAAVLDISGGDSFADLYSKKQLDLIMLPKRIALNRRKPLLLLPQTYGPFEDPTNARRAVEVLRHSTQAWARDEHSFQRLKELLGGTFDPARHRCGVDVAFGLSPRVPEQHLGPITSWLTDGRPVIGLNVSGMLYNDSRAAQRRFGLLGNYREVMDRVVHHFLGETDVRIVVVPHVGGRHSHNSDVAAAATLVREHGGHPRLAALPEGLGADGIKHVVSRFDWFAGARMHSTIASLSMRRPTVAVAYSDKFQGVFEACGLGARVLDARTLDADELVRALLAAWSTRDQDEPLLHRHLPEVERRLDAQFDELVSTMYRVGRSRPG